jgi:PAS domain S-box-containing protein
MEEWGIMREERSELQELRERAERRLRAEPPGSGFPHDHRTLAHELRVHQVELQMQNDALRETELELAGSRARYRALYELSPVACLSVGPDTRIGEANQAAAALLGAADAKALLDKRFSRFLVPEHSERFEHHRRELYAHRRPCDCELSLIANQRRLDVRLQSTWLEGTIGPQWLIALVDLTASRVAPAGAAALGCAIGAALVVEDDQLVRAAIRRHLELIGCPVFEAASGRDALELLRRDAGNFLRLLVCDVSLPDVPARTLVAQVRALRPDLRLLMMSPFPPSYPAHAPARALGAVILGKPYTVEQLHAALQSLLEAEQPSDR